MVEDRALIVATLFVLVFLGFVELYIQVNRKNPH